MRVGVDTSLLAYAEGVNDPERQAAALVTMARVAHHELVLPVQVAAEMFRVLLKRKRLAARDARSIVDEWVGRAAQSPATTGAILAESLGLATDHRFQIFDAIILAASAEAGCRMLLTEDMQDGFVWRGVTVVNPFAASPHPMLADLLRH
jgi:predicted nucleic acid-binding protein